MCLRPPHTHCSMIHTHVASMDCMWLRPRPLQLLASSRPRRCQPQPRLWPPHLSSMQHCAKSSSRRRTAETRGVLCNPNSASIGVGLLVVFRLMLHAKLCDESACCSVRLHTKVVLLLFHHIQIGRVLTLAVWSCPLCREQVVLCQTLPFLWQP